MSFGGPSKSCPRCNTVLPASATFCGTCGYQFSAPSAPGAPPASDFGGPTQYVGQGAPGSYPPSSAPAYAPPGQPGYGAYPPQAQPGYAGYQPAGQPAYPGAYAPPVAAPPQKGGAGKAIILVLVLVVLVGGGAAAWFLYLNPSHTSSPFFDRHGLQSNVPLPNDVTFVLQKTFSQTDSSSNATIAADAWGWQVNGSNAVDVQQFYQNNLPKNGWANIHPLNSNNGDRDIYGCQGGQVLVIGANDTKIEGTDQNGQTITITAPSGGSALITELSSSPALVQILCSNNPTP